MGTAMPPCAAAVRCAGPAAFVCKLLPGAGIGEPGIAVLVGLPLAVPAPRTGYWPGSVALVGRLLAASAAALGKG